MPSLMEGMRRLYPAEDVRRLAYTQSPGGDVVSVDVHGMKCWQAKQFINNINLDNKRIMDRAADQFNLGITYLAIA